MSWTYLGMEAAGSGAELEVELTFCTLFVVGVSVESWARGTFPMRYQIPMLLSSLQETGAALSVDDPYTQHNTRVRRPP